MNRKILLAIAWLWIKLLDYQIEQLLKSRGLTYDRKLWVEAEHYRRPNGQFGKGGWKQTKPSEKINSKKKEGNKLFSENKTKKGRKLATPELCEKIEKALRKEKLLGDGLKVLPPDRIKIKGISPHARKRFKDRDASKEIAQHYVDTALVRIKESPDKYAYLSEDGTSVVIENGLLVTVIPSKNYNKNQKRKVEVILSWLN